MRHLTLQQVVQIHSFVVDETGGLHGIRDPHRLESAVVRPKQAAFGKELFPTVFEKAAAYAHSFIADHPFLDGNKRTGMTSAAVFLEDNGFLFNAKLGEIERFALRIATEKLGVPAIASWLKRHSREV